MLQNGDFAAITEITVNKEVAFVTELLDKENGNYMYMVQNIVDSKNQGSNVYQTSEITFDAKYQKAIVYHKGEKKIVSLQNNKLIGKIYPGDAYFVTPF